MHTGEDGRFFSDIHKWINFKRAFVKILNLGAGSCDYET
jgi:hypothetical protein